ncbi:MAG: hypothetical protein FWG91_13650 [Lachnospiraceae bacterium]|nr:hypothetical protein [Lachnospiraceae bacterium]
MDFSDQNRVAAFDTLFTTNQIQRLKVFMSFLDEKWQKHLAVYIKYLELQYTIAFSRRGSFCFHDGCEKENNGDFQSLIKAIMPYSQEKDRKMFEQFSGMLKTMEMFKQLAPMMEMMKNIMPDMADGEGMFGNISSLLGGLSHMGGDSGPDDMMMNMLMGMMTPEQIKMYEMFSDDPP